MNACYTFTSLFKNAVLLNEGNENTAVISKVVIPRIQRPYAQGRRIEESNKVRENFLKELFAVLRGEDEMLDLNFVYGKVELIKKDGADHAIMELLDGQQRFTTLYLLYWYLVNREQVRGQVGADIARALTSFEYETRETSTEFCKMLGRLVAGGNRFTFSRLGHGGEVCSMPPSEAIKASLDYVHSFAADPTISAMLTMLDAMHEAYNGKGYVEFSPGQHGERWKNLEKIRFNVLSLTRYKLSEELYIKMNARGLPLSPFDCFKADFLGLMDLPGVKVRTGRMVHLNSGLDAGEQDEDAVTFKQYFATKLDCSWCDLFWKAADPDSFDSSYMLFFARYFAARFIIEHQNDVRDWQHCDDLRMLHRSYEQDPNHYHGIREYYEMVRLFGDKVDYFDDIAKLLDLLKERKQEILAAMKPIWEPEIAVQADYFCDGGLKLEQMPLVTLAASILFFHYFPCCPVDLFRIWMKSVNCVVENTNIDSYIPASGTVGKLAILIGRIATKKPDTELKFYQAMAAVSKGEIGAAAVEEEIEKARRIAENANMAAQWRELFDEISKHPFLKGMMGFYYSDEMSYDDFSSHCKLIFSLFDENGIAPAYRDDEHCLLRAVMSRIVSWPELSGRFVVESNVKKYLKNLISALDSQALKDRMHELFAVKLFGMKPADLGAASEEVLGVLQDVVKDAPPIAGNETWDVREALEVLRQNVDFYRWALSRNGDVKVYWQQEQVIARVPKKWSCVMMSVFRFADRLANELNMERIAVANGRDGYDVKYHMFVGSDCQMQKQLTNIPWALVRTRFYTSYRQGYPIEVSVCWPKDVVGKEQEEALRHALGDKEIDISGDEKSIRICEPLTFSQGDVDNELISYIGLKQKVEGIINLNAQEAEDKE